MPDTTLTSAELDELEALAKAATPGDLDTVNDPPDEYGGKSATGWYECPCCESVGEVEGVTYSNFDAVAMGVQFFGIGNEHKNYEAFFRAANPATILRLLSLARAGLEAGKAEEWLPIETAPKDGTEIILGSEPQTFNSQPVPARVTIGHWTTEEECRVDIGDCGGDCHCREYEHIDPSWISWDGGFTAENPATHWRPLPAPPAIRALPLTGVDKP